MQMSMSSLWENESNELHDPLFKSVISTAINCSYSTHGNSGDVTPAMVRMPVARPNRYGRFAGHDLQLSPGRARPTRVAGDARANGAWLPALPVAALLARRGARAAKRPQVTRWNPAMAASMPAKKLVYGRFGLAGAAALPKFAEHGLQ